jgi:predicted ATPase
MPDPRNELQGRFRAAARFGNFGNVLTQISIKGIRCHVDTAIDLASPITAFSGLNGTGKTTVLHVAAAAYTSSNGYSVNSFLAKGPLDQSPFRSDASILFQIEAPNNARVPLTISYNPQSSRWQGYGRRQPRNTFLFGVGFFLPSNEKRDFVFRNASNLQVQSTDQIDDCVREWCCRILSNGYGAISSINVKHKNQTASILSTQRSGTAYSEAHMGCGEGRVHTIVRTLEACPEKSLILLEEPEISLHAKAEYELGKYLIDLAIRRGHQILITTHSERLMRALPQASLVHLCRTNAGIETVPGIPSFEAESLMSEGYDKALTIIVEDSVAKTVLSELLRKYDPYFLKSVHIAIGRFEKPRNGVQDSGKEAIRRVMRTLSEAGLRMAAVLDGDDQEDVGNSIYKLPGSRPPEEELIANDSVMQLLSGKCGTPVTELRTQLGQFDSCHEYFPYFARLMADDPHYVVRIAAEVFATSADTASIRRLIEQLKENTV